MTHALIHTRLHMLFAHTHKLIHTHTRIYSEKTDDDEDEDYELEPIILSSGSANA